MNEYLIEHFRNEFWIATNYNVFLGNRTVLSKQKILLNRLILLQLYLLKHPLLRQKILGLTLRSHRSFGFCFLWFLGNGSVYLPSSFFLVRNSDAYLYQHRAQTRTRVYLSYLCATSEYIDQICANSLIKNIYEKKLTCQIFR